MNGDEKISRRYRELPREEPPRHLDDAILAASRRAVHTRPAPLVAPTGRQRWYFPVAAAAIIVLAVAVTMHVEREQPAEEIVSSAPQPSAPAAAAPPAPELMREEAKPQAEKPKPAPQPERFRRAAPGSRELPDAPSAPTQDTANAVQESARSEMAMKPAPPTDLGAAASMGRAQSQSEPSPAPAPVPAPQAAPAPEAKPAPGRSKAITASKPSAELRRADEAARDTSPLAKFAGRAPEQWLQGIADLRSQGRHEEADKELAEFRKRHPDYRIAPTMRERVERR
jgi:hypothetical protein